MQFIGKTYPPTNAILYDNDDYFWSDDKENSWICFDFKNRKVILESYTIKSANNDSYTTQPRNWIIEGSNDNNLWFTIDLKRNCSTLNEPFYDVFKVTPQKQLYRFLRIRQTDANWGSTHYLQLSCIEFFGKLF